MCFFINPIAGIGGPLGLKGSDLIDPRHIARTIHDRLSLPSIQRARRFLMELSTTGLKAFFYTPTGIMGGDLLESIGFPSFEKIMLKTPYTDGMSTREHTAEFVRLSSSLGCDVLVFTGGDGTARDIYSSNRYLEIPVLGIPAGVKVYSGVFATGPESAAYLLKLYADGIARIEMRPVVDADEESLRRGVLDLRKVGMLPTIAVPGLIQGSKEAGASYDVEGIARYLSEAMERNRLYLLGPGRTIAEIARILGLEKTIYGVDAVYNNKIIGKDLDENSIKRLIEKYGEPKIIITPIRGTGFLLGRGNQQLSPEIIRKAGKKNIIIVMTQEKASTIETLLVDTGDKHLDQELEGYYRALVGYREEKIVRVKPSWKIDNK